MELVATESVNLLKTKRYILFWISSLFSNMGTWMQQIAEPWLVLSISQSALWVGLDSFALNAPGWIFTLWGGVLADRKDRKRIILFFQGAQWLCVLALVILLLVGWLKVWMIVVISFFVGLTDSLSMPSFQSIIPSLVSSKDIPRAVAFNSAQFNLSRVIGPAVAGIVIARYGVVACFGANAISYLPFFLSVYWIYPKGVVKTEKNSPATQPVSHILEYKKILKLREVRLPLFTILVTSLFCAPLITFAPVIIKDVFHSGVGGFGWAMAAFGVGGILGAGTSLIPLPELFKRDKLSMISAVLLSFIIICVAYNRSEFFLILLLIFSGALLTVANVSANSFLQQTAGSHSLGRMASLYQLALHGGVSIGALMTGFTVNQLGISNALMLNGSAAVVLQILILWKRSQSRQTIV